MRRGPLAVLVLGLLLAGGALGYSRIRAPQPLPAVRVDGVTLQTGAREVSPHPALTVGLPQGTSVADYRASLDGAPVRLEPAGGSSARVVSLALPQSTWHRLEVWRPGFGGGRDQLTQVDFRTTEPLQLAVAWLVTASGTRADISWSRPLVDDASLVAALRNAGAASVAKGGGGVTARWDRARTGESVAFSVAAGLSATTGAYLQDSFSPELTLPAKRPYANVQLSGAQAASTAGLKLQMYFISTPAARADLARHARQIAILSPNFYSVAADGSVRSGVDLAALEVARQAGVEVQPLVTNQDFDAAAASQLLADDAHADGLASALVTEARARAYTGYQLDFENIFPTDRNALTSFSNRLGGRLQTAGLKYSVAVVPRKQLTTSGLDSFILRVAGAYDYAGLSQKTNWLAFMAYDQHARSSDPGPVAGLDWVRQVAQGSSAGLDRGKVFLGVPLYYRDWSVGGLPVAGSYDEAIGLAAQNGAGLGWDFDAATPYIRYASGAQQHLLWLDDRASLEAKLALARDLHFAGVASWRLGFEDPDFWDLWPPS